MIEYKKVGLDFATTAPITLECQAELPVSAEELFRCFQRSDTWGWASIKSVEWETPTPYGEGTTRTIETLDQGKVQEYFFLWDDPKRMAFRFERGEMKLVNAFAENYRVEDLGESCRLTWYIGIELRGFFKVLSPILKMVMQRQFASMLDGLVAYLRDEYKGKE